MSIGKKVSSWMAVDRAKDMMAREDDHLDPVMKIWATEAEDAIDSFYQYEEKNMVLDVCQCYAVIPCEVAGILAVAQGDLGTRCDKDFRNAFGFISNSTTWYASAFPIFVIIGMGVSVAQGLSWTVQGNKIIFSQNMHEEKVTIRALCYKIDDEGWIMVSDSHIRAIAQYIEWRYMRRNNHIPKVKQYTQSEIRYAEKEWSRLAQHCNVQDGKPNEEQKRAVADLYNDPFSGYSRATFLRTNSYYGLHPGI